MAESRFAIAELEAEMAAEYRLQALAARHDADTRRRQAMPETRPDGLPEAEAEAQVDIDIDPWRPLFEGE